MDNERRQYFRIDDAIHLNYRVLDEASYRERTEHPAQGGEPGDAMLQLHNLTVQSGNVLAVIRKRDPEIGQYLAILDKKVELLSRVISGGPLGGILPPDTPVTLGAGGIDFVSDESLATGTRLELRLILFPSHQLIHCLGKVTHCTATAGKRYQLGVDFTDISEMARNAIVRHTLELQSAQLRQQKEQRNDTR